MLVCLGAKLHVPRPDLEVIKQRYAAFDEEGLRAKDQGWYTIERGPVVNGWVCWCGVKCAGAQEYDEHLATHGQVIV